MTPEIPATEDTIEYCLGLKYAGRREFTESERANMRRECVRRRRRFIGACFVVPILLIVCLGIGASIEDAKSAFAPLLVLAIVLVPTVAVTIYGQDDSKIRGWILEALEANYVEIYRDRSSYLLFDHITGDLRKLFTGEKAEIEILPQNHRVWTINGVRVNRGMILNPVVMPGGNHIKVIPEDGPAEYSERAMTAEEQEELLTSFPVLWVLVLPTFAITLIAVFFWNKAMAHHTVTDHGAESLGLKFALLMDFVVGKMEWRSWRFRQDARNGRILIVRPVSPVRHPDDQEVAQVLEVLPVTKFIWSVDGEPAPGRLQTAVTQPNESAP